ncbi:helix-turn-helix domain-containing protein (plasmid) [Paenibacillus sonchi]|uniref:Helix-turn-helix domain-containing protein n=1 Tax=Paenibacillus sonchi TaxID=373687 RepID=A0A974PIH8_9BACL|nr:helix-turn-helix domain-containing protein [Paenibacillus sonchi]QQZ64471.1 helix-turn-helix domain-containing protein [Paenibacillus sonchi]
MDKYLTVVEVAEILKLTVSTVYKLIDHDNLDQTNSAKKLKPINPTTYRGEGGYRFSPEEIERIKPYYVKEKLTPAEASKKIGRSTTYIYKLLKKGLPYERAVYRGKETYLISPGDLEPYVNEKTNFGKYDTIFDKKTGVYLFQLYTLNNQIGRIISIKRVNHKRIESVLQVEGKQIPLEEALSKGWVPVTTIGERKIVTSYGYASFVFPIPMDMSSMIYETINILFELAGPLNLRVSVRGSSIYVDVKKCIYQ